MEKIILWCTDRTSSKDEPKKQLEPDERAAVAFLHKLLECDPEKRITAEKALKDPFLNEYQTSDDAEDEDIVDMIDS